MSQAQSIDEAEESVLLPEDGSRPRVPVFIVATCCGEPGAEASVAALNTLEFGREALEERYSNLSFPKPIYFLDNACLPGADHERLGKDLFQAGRSLIQHRGGVPRSLKTVWKKLELLVQQGVIVSAPQALLCTS